MSIQLRCYRVGSISAICKPQYSPDFNCSIKVIFMNKFLIISVVFNLLMVFATMVMADGLTPILDPKGYRQTLPGMPPPQLVPSVGTLKGTIQTTDGKPLSGGKMYIFNADKGPPPVTGKYLRVPDETASLDVDGGFSVALIPGRYYIGALLRKWDNAMIGYPAEGDIYYDGKELYEIIPGSINNINVIRGGKQFRIDKSTKAESVTAIGGTVTDPSGKPVENVLVFAYAQLEMNGRPMFASAPTGKNGDYRLMVAGEGTFFLRCSDVYGKGMLTDGKVIGLNWNNVTKAVSVKEGEIVEGVNIEVKFVSPR